MQQKVTTRDLCESAFVFVGLWDLNIQMGLQWLLFFLFTFYDRKLLVGAALQFSIFIGIVLR